LDIGGGGGELNDTFLDFAHCFDVTAVHLIDFVGYVNLITEQTAQHNSEHAHHELEVRPAYSLVNFTIKIGNVILVAYR
jgi:hypothetical protein